MTTHSLHVGLDLGGTYLKLALLDEGGQVVRRQTTPTLGHEGPDAVIDRMVQGIQKLVAQQPGRDSVRSIGLGVPGQIDMAQGTTIEIANLPGDWLNVPVATRVERQTGLPSFLINDVRAFSVAESLRGAAKGARTAVCVAIGTGIGGGIVTDGKVHFGLGGAAGELGHIVVLPGGPQCGCGNRGCVETFASGPSIAAEAIRRVLQGFTTELAHRAGADLNVITPKLVAEVADAGDAVAINVLERAGYYLGLTLAGTIATVAPEVVVIGGGVAQPGGVYWRAIEQTARAHCRVTDIDRIVFLPAALGYDAGVIGAALWGMQQVGSALDPEPAFDPSPPNRTDSGATPER